MIEACVVAARAGDDDLAGALHGRMERNSYTMMDKQEIDRRQFIRKQIKKDEEKLKEELTVLF